MWEEADVLDTLQGLEAELSAFPPKAHWFCPRQYDEDYTDYDHPDEPDDNISAEVKQKLIGDSKKRHNVAYQYALVFGESPDVVGNMVDDYLKKLNKLLSACDKCVHNWHMGRKAFLADVAEQYNDEVAIELSSRLDQVDFQRIDNGLISGKKLLEKSEPSERSQKLLAINDPAALLALYEALCCANYHKNDAILAAHFNYVFTEVQTKKVLRIGDILPAMARFLFSNDYRRRQFAITAWAKMTATLTPRLFDWAIHDVLTAVIESVAQSVDLNEINMFWEGFILMLEKMDQGLITHSLRAMEVQPPVYMLTLQHLSCPSDTTLKLVLKAIESLLAKGPKDFWSALGTVSPASLADMIFSSPGYRMMLSNQQGLEGEGQFPVIATSWIPHFLKSLEPIQQTDACRMLLSNLMEHLQDVKYLPPGREACFLAGLDALHISLQTFVTADYKINPSTSLIVISGILELVAKYAHIIVSSADGDVKLRPLGMVVIKDALALDCKAISAEFFALNNGTVVQRGDRKHSQAIWQAVLDIFRPGNVELAKSILPATIALIGLDELRPPTKRQPLQKDHMQFNQDLQQLWDNIARIFERLSDFSVSHLGQLCQDTVTARPLFAALVSADQNICEASVEVLKAMTGQSSKQDAFQSVLEVAFYQMLNGLTNAFTHISKCKNFGPIPAVIRTGREVLKALCGSTGALRTRATFNSTERNSVLGWWTCQWKTLDVVFAETEGWAPRVDKPTAWMQDFLRDAMEYAEALFNEYTIFASALREPSPPLEEQHSGKPSSSKAAISKVLDVICRSINGLVGMLRLRDAYLISVITSLLGKLLRCLGDYQLEVHEYAAMFIKDACKRENSAGSKRTNLTSQQKAELQRALDEHQGVEIIEMSKPTIKKQATIDSWSKSADGRQYEPKLPKSTLAVDRNREMLDKFKADQRAKQAVTDQSRQSLIQSRKKADEDRKRRDAEAIAKAKALRGPLVRGEGSGLQNIGGIAGKDHAPVRSEIMVGSSDEDSDDDDDVDETDVLVKRQNASSKRVAEYEESRKRALKMPQGPVRKTKIQRSAKDLRARVEPNMDLLYLEILNWDIFYDSDEPPSNNPCRRIDDKYLDLDLYKRTFGPLLISEVWRSLVTAKEENNFKPIEIKVLNRLSVDKFMEISTTMPMTTNRDLKMSERDIVLLSKSSDPMKHTEEPHCLARVDRTNRRKDVIEVTFRVSREVSPKFLPSFVPNGKVFAVKIADMTTTQREYAALSSLEYYDLCTEVLEAKPSPLMNYSDEKISVISQKYTLNRGQSKAILSANENDGFTLIQGPPGSGKTKTIVAMVGSLLTQTLQQQQVDQLKARAPPQGQRHTPQGSGPKKKLLICAPSNAAVDELVVRLKGGVQPLNGPLQKINVIRLGRSDAINDSVKDVMLDELVRMKLEGDDGTKNKLLQERDNLHKDAIKIKERLNVLRPQMDEARGKGDDSLNRRLQREFDELKRAQARIGAKIDEDKESGNTVSRQNEINRRRFQQEIIDGAHVLCATLSGSGHDMFKHINVEFETVIIDEAAQCIELSALIPLKYGCSKCILVGDPEQLPPTVLSRFAQSYGYEQSLFVRMQKNYPQDIHLLDTQYRMHPEISRFPSQQFYNSRLVDGDGMANLRRQPWHQSSILGPYRFFDVRGIQTKQAHGHSFINVPELNAALKLYARLKADFRSVDFKGKIGIITTYKAQLNEMKARFSAQYGDAIFEEIEFNTTDAFQGREREIIIFSCVRAKATGGIGFLGDIRRMNVGLTRAKSSLWVLGDSRSLQQGEFWNRLIEDAKTRDRYTSGDVMNLLSKPTSRDWKPEVPLIESLPAQADNSDVEMKDASSTPTSGRSTPVATSIPSRPINPPIKEEPRKSHLGSSNLPVENNKKRARDSLDERALAHAKKAHTATKPEKISDLDLALRAQEAAKAAKPQPVARPMRPPGVAPRRPAPADPFIKRKPPKRG